jgi:hypothetical protein
MYIYEVIIFITGQSMRMMVMVVKDMEVARAVQLVVSVVERAVHLANLVGVRVVELAVLVVARAA